MATGFIYDEAYLRHDTGFHVERAKRLAHTVEFLRKRGVLDTLVGIEPRAASLVELAEVHHSGYIDKVREFSARGGGNFGDNNVGSRETYEIALLAAGGVLSAVEAVMDRRVDNAFALVRPPGHHAKPGLGMGFCYFNNVAVAARYAMRRYGLERILVVDWDEHHGNGTENIFFEDPKVLCFSVHRDWSYPGTGLVKRVGYGEGEGYNINVPLPGGSGDHEYEVVFRRILMPVSLAFRPDLIIISAGMDAHKDDPIGRMQMTPGGFATLTSLVREIADYCCNGAIVAVLEGGYNLQGLAESVMAVLQVMSGTYQVRTDEGNRAGSAVTGKALQVLDEVVATHSQYWPVLK